MLNNKFPLFPNLHEDDEDSFLSCEEDDDDENNFLSCKEEDDDEFFELESSQALDNPHDEPPSTMPHVRQIREDLNNNLVKKSLMQKLFNWFRGLIKYLKNIWFSNPVKQDEPATDRDPSIGNTDNSDQSLNTPENAIATNCNLNNHSFLAPNSYPNTFYQKAKKEHAHPIQASKYGLN